MDDIPNNVEQEIPQQPMPQTPPPPQSAPVIKKSHTLLIGGSLLFILLFVAGVSLFIYQNSKATNTGAMTKNASQKETAPWKITKDTKSTQKIFTDPTGHFMFYIPASWDGTIRTTGGTPCIATNESTTQAVCQKGKLATTATWATQLGFTDLGDISQLPEKEALKLSEVPDFIPLIAESYLTINNTPAYKSMRQFKKGSSYSVLKASGDVSADGIWNETTRTEYGYSFLYNDKLYRLYFQINDENPEPIIKQIDEMAQSATFK